MSHELAVAERTQFAIEYSTSDLLRSIRPFIVAVADGLGKAWSVEESVLRGSDAYPDAAEYFVIEPGRLEETFGLRTEYLFTDWQPTALHVRSKRSIFRIDLSGDDDAASRQLKLLLELCSSGTCTEATVSSSLDDERRRLFESLLRAGVFVQATRSVPGLAPDGMPGIYRLQHASLLYRTATTGILVDPHLHSTYGRDVRQDVYRDCLQGKVDAILISHFHEDHWFLSSLMMFPSETLIVVPKVPASTIICSDMERLLRRCGFTNVIAADWYSEPLRVGDAEVFVLPFYGEQPLRFEHPRFDALRNWGNTYVVRTADYVSWFLIDSGSDARGSMIEVAEHVRKRIGPIDCVLSNLRDFHISSPLYINGGLNWLTLSPPQLKRFSTMSEHVITLGPHGVAEVCRQVGARHYLPYAHWWGELGGIPNTSADMPGHHELDLTRRLADSLRAARADTEIVPWHVGDGFVPEPGAGFRVAPIG